MTPEQHQPQPDQASGRQSGGLDEESAAGDPVEREETMPTLFDRRKALDGVLKPIVDKRTEKVTRGITDPRLYAELRERVEWELLPPSELDPPKSA